MNVFNMIRLRLPRYLKDVLLQSRTSNDSFNIVKKFLSDGAVESCCHKISKWARCKKKNDVLKPSLLNLFFVLKALFIVVLCAPLEVLGLRARVTFGSSLEKAMFGRDLDSLRNVSNLVSS